ncbi:MAG: tetratricopeptide repeat protein [Acidiferrobacterales bacterium]
MQIKYKNKSLIKILALLSLVIVSTSVSAEKKSAEYVGATVCAECHSKQTDAWKGSDHDLAMQHANKKSVLGDFNGKKFSYNGITSTFFKKGEKFLVNTDGPDGKLKDFQIKYTFGVEPLQQYLIEMPGGRLQVLGIAWDSRTKDKGGQRWYHLYPNENVTFKNSLHWTRADQNWNYMCADCHSTNLKKNYNFKNNTYKTSWSEINVSCEACHGPASAHVNWANKGSGWQQRKQDKGLTVNLDERSGVSWKINPQSGSARRSKIKTTNKEIEICARCHSRRSKINNDYAHNKPLMDSFLPAFLTDFLYYPDGQIKEEVYVYGSFVQSKMYRNGVTCSDCHEPHNLKLRTSQGETDNNQDKDQANIKSNSVCLQCHEAKKFNKKSHHFHKPDSAGASCVSCHMPETIYMGVDGRNDHSIRIPRPDLSIKLKTPNACNQCHKNKNAQWANKQMQSWYGKDWAPGWHFGETLYAARTGSIGIGTDLAAVAASPKLPAIARASAASLLRNYPGPITYAVVQKLLKDKSPMIRLSALQTLDTMPVSLRLKPAVPLLDDPVRAVRIEAARVLAVVPRNMLSVQQQSMLDKALDEYRQAQRVNADRPESYINLGLLAIRLQNFTEAEKLYQQALKLDPGFANAYVNLADLYRSQQQDQKAEQVLKKALKLSNQNAAAHHALGLLYIRKKQLDKALRELKTAWKLQANNARYGYVYAVALNSRGQSQQAMTTLKKIHKQHPTNIDVVSALVAFNRDAGKPKEALVYAKKLQVLLPDNPQIKEMIQALENKKQ